MRRVMLALSVSALLSACATAQPVTAPGVQAGDVIVFPGRQAVMMYADVKQGVRDLLGLVEALCARKVNAKQCGDVDKIRQEFRELDIRTRALLLSPAPTGQAGPDYAAIAEMLGKLVGVAAGIAL